jgi:hypothetical protein
MNYESKIHEQVSLISPFRMKYPFLAPPDEYNLIQCLPGVASKCEIVDRRLVTIKLRFSSWVGSQRKTGDIFQKNKPTLNYKGVNPTASKLCDYTIFPIIWEFPHNFGVFA